MTVPPEKVLRFYCNADFALETIGFKQITFLHSSKFNDPFDPYFYFITDFDEDYQKLIDWVKSNQPEKLNKVLTCIPDEERWLKILQTIKQNLYKQRETAYFFSVCGVNDEIQHPKDNLYMWGHYGNGHRGIAIEFDASLLGQSLSKLEGPREIRNDDELWEKIHYYPSGTKEIPKINYEEIVGHISNNPEVQNKNLNNSPIFKKFYLTARLKHDVWKLENEWRLMLENKESKVKYQRILLEENSITSIYLGYKCPEEIKNDIIQETKQNFPCAKVFESGMVIEKMALEFKQLYPKI